MVMQVPVSRGRAFRRTASAGEGGSCGLERVVSQGRVEFQVRRSGDEDSVRRRAGVDGRIVGQVGRHHGVAVVSGVGVGDDLEDRRRPCGAQVQQVGGGRVEEVEGLCRRCRHLGALEQGRMPDRAVLVRGTTCIRSLPYHGRLLTRGRSNRGLTSPRGLDTRPFRRRRSERLESLGVGRGGDGSGRLLLLCGWRARVDIVPVVSDDFVGDIDDLEVNLRY